MTFATPSSPSETPPADCLVSPHLSEDLLAIYRRLPPANLAVLASGSGSNFEALLQAIADGQLNANVRLLVYNNPGAKVAARAERWGVPARCIDHRTFGDRQDFDRTVVEALQAAGADWAVLAGWMRRATEPFLEAFPDRAINIHPSLLPSFPGIRGVEQALAAGVKISGCTTHLVRLEVDAGPILMQAAVPVLADDTPETLHARIQIQEHRILPASVALAVARANA